MNTKLIGTVIGVVVAIIVIAGALMPAIGIYDEEHSHTNEAASGFYAEFIPADGEYRIEHVHGTTTWNLDGNEVVCGLGTILYSTGTNSIVLAANTNGMAMGWNLYPASPYFQIEGGQLKYEQNGVETTRPWNGGFVRTTEKTEWVFSQSDAVKYVTPGEKLNWSVSSWANASTFFDVEVDTSDGSVQILGHPEGVTDVTSHFTDQSNIDGYFTFKTLVIEYKYNGSDATSTLSSVVIPRVAQSTEKNESISSLLGAIPVVVIVAIVAGVATSVLRNRD